MERRRWRKREPDDNDNLNDIYDTYKDLFTIYVHYDGKFTKNPNTEYVDGKIQAFDFIEHDVFSMHDMNDMIREIGYDGIMYYHFLLPKKDLDVGLRPLGTDKDIIKMISYVPKFQEINVYVEHGVTTLEDHFLPKTGCIIEEIDAELNVVDFKNSRFRKPLLIEGPGEQSKQPNKETIVEENVTQNVEGYGSNVAENEADEEEIETEEQENQADEEENESRTEGDDSEDGDFEPEKERDDGDDDSEVDEHVGGGAALDKEGDDDYEVDMKNFQFNFEKEVKSSEKKEFTPQIGELEMNEEVVPIDFDDFDSGPDEDTADGDRKKKLKHLRRKQIYDPNIVVKSRFYVSQVFSSKKPVKAMIKQHAIDTRRNIKLVKDDNERVRARCFGMASSSSKPVMTKNFIRQEKQRLASPEKSQKTKEKTTAEGQSDKEGQKSKNDKGKGVIGELCQDKEVQKAKKPTCPWTLHVSKSKGENRWMVKTLIDEHTCLQVRELRQCDSTFICNQIIDTVDADPRIKGAAIVDIVSKRFQLGIKRMTAQRAKQKAKKLLAGDYNLQYERLRDYGLELMRRNPNTTVRIDVHPEPNPNSETRIFRRIYVCLGPLKEGFKACGRDLLGFDGAFMKGPYPGQVLTGVGVDPNNGIYPLAYAVVEAETFDSWKWFLELIAEDLDIPTNGNFTFISDRQKGLIPALAKVFPSAEHRYCLRHIYENMSKTFKGEIIRELLWKCATRTNVMDFDAAMEELRVENDGAYKYLKAINPQHWSRAHFSGRAHCDILLNNICESFNSRLVEAREKPIISCLEYIREYLMKRVVVVQKVIDVQKGPLTPAATMLFEVIKTAANKCTAIWNGLDKFQVKDSYREQCVVDIRLRTCTCGNWQLTGIPCKHAVCGLWDAKNNSIWTGELEDWVHACYRLDTWKEVYNFKIEPVVGSTSWPKSECPTRLLPPKHKTQVGRPKKQRKKSTMEIEAAKMVKNGKISRKGKSITCGKCGNKGHNAANCKGQGGATQAGPSQSSKGVKRKKTAGVTASQPTPVVKRTKRTAAQAGESASQPTAGVKRTRKSASQVPASASQVPASASQVGCSQPLGTQ